MRDKPFTSGSIFANGECGTMPKWNGSRRTLNPAAAEDAMVPLIWYFLVQMFARIEFFHMFTFGIIV